MLTIALRPMAGDAAGVGAGDSSQQENGSDFLRNRKGLSCHVIVQDDMRSFRPF
jgi:hypothetical protein